MTEMQFLEKHTKLEVNECSCSKCVSMCKTAVCIGTPLDIARLIVAGHADKLCFTLWSAGKPWGDHRQIDMVQLEFDKQKGCCTMLDGENKCRLHASGLKPSEGKLANCSMTKYLAQQIPSALLIAHSWTDANNFLLIGAIHVIMDLVDSGGKIGPEEQNFLSLIINKFYSNGS